EAGQQVLGDLLGVPARQDDVQHELHELVVLDVMGAQFEEALPGTIAVTDIVRRGLRQTVSGRAGPLAHSTCSPGWRGLNSPRGERVKISWPVSVMPIECSACALSVRSRVTAVQPSDRIFTWGRPRLIIGSMVKIMPGLSS